MKTQLIIGLAVLSIAVILFGISLPVLLFSSSCSQTFPDGTCFRSIPPPSHETELALALFGIPFAIGGIGLLVLYRLEQPKVKENA